MVTESDVNELVDKVEKVTKRRELDLSSDADLSIGIMNLINLEEHLFFTGRMLLHPGANTFPLRSDSFRAIQYSQKTARRDVLDLNLIKNNG